MATQPNEQATTLRGTSGAQTARDLTFSTVTIPLSPLGMPSTSLSSPKPTIEKSTSKKLAYLEFLEEQAKEIKILLVGCPEGGKATIMNALSLLYTKQFATPSDREFHKQILICNLFDCIVALSTAATQLGLSLSETNKQRVKRIEMLRESALSALPEVRNMCSPSFQRSLQCAVNIDSDISNIFSDEAIQTAWKRRSAFQLPRNAEYYITGFTRVLSPTFVPDDTDMLVVQISEPIPQPRTLEFHVEDTKIKVVHCGGQRADSQHWVSSFNKAKALLFVVPLVEYDLPLAEEPDQNRLRESLLLWQRMYAGKPKLPFSECENSVKSADEALEYLERRFLAKNVVKGRRVQVIKLSVVDIEQTARMFEQVLATARAGEPETKWFEVNEVSQGHFETSVFPLLQSRDANDAIEALTEIDFLLEHSEHNRHVFLLDGGPRHIMPFIKDESSKLFKLAKGIAARCIAAIAADNGLRLDVALLGLSDSELEIFLRNRPSIGANTAMVSEGSTNRMSLSISSAPTVGMPRTAIKRGFLWKLGKVRKSWRQRFFVLLSTSDVLSYFESDTAPKPKGAIDLCAITAVWRRDVLSLGETLPSQIYSGARQVAPFEVVADNRVFLLIASSDTERSEWMNAIELRRKQIAERRAASAKSRSRYGGSGSGSSTQKVPNDSQRTNSRDSARSSSINWNAPITQLLRAMTRRRGDTSNVTSGGCDPFPGIPLHELPDQSGAPFPGIPLKLEDGTTVADNNESTQRLKQPISGND